jgi:hypothetical protein
MSAIAKSQALIRALKDNLQKRLPSTYILAESVDAAGARLSIQQDSSWATTEQKAVIRIVAQDTQFSNSIGNAQAVYSPLKAQMIAEGDSSSPSKSQLSWANDAKIMAELFRAIGKVELYLTDVTVDPALSLFASDGSVTTSATCALIESISADLRWPLSGQ